MRLLALLFTLVAIAGVRAPAQEAEVCRISSFVIPWNAKESEVDKFKPIEIAKLDISGVTEGSRLSKTFRVPGTKLWTYVEVFFDDDMKYYDSLYDALTVNVVVSTARKRTKNNVVGLATTQTAFDESFKQVDTLGFAKIPGKRIGVVVSCRGKKPKDE